MPTYSDFGGWVISTIAGWFVVTADKITSKRRELYSGAHGIQMRALPTGSREREERCSFTPI
jgi:hypothetical protein